MTGQTTVNGSISAKIPGQRSILWKIAVIMAISGSTALIFWQFWSLPSNENPDTVSQPQVKTVTALGRLEPEGEVVKVYAANTSSSRVEQLLVKEGDRVKAGEAIAILAARDRLQANLEEAQQRVRQAKAELARVLAGAKTGEIEAQRAAIAQAEAERRNDLEAQAATVARLTTEYQNAQVEYQRYQALYNEGAVSAQQRDSKSLSFASAQRQLQAAQASLNRIRSAQQQQVIAAKATLAQIAEVRPVDVQVAEAEVSSAQAAAKQAQAELAEAYVRAPQAGQVLQIYTRAGEQISSENGIVELGQTQQMYAVAEVYQSDISKVRVGQRVQITSQSLPDTELWGTIEQIGIQVKRQAVINSDPSANIDDRVIEVKVRLDPRSSQQVAGLTNLQIKATIEL